jgi:hypothetical protein
VVGDEYWDIISYGLGPAGERIVNTFHYYWYNPAESPINGDDLCTAFEGAVATPLLAVVTQEYTYDFTRAVCVSGPNAHFEGTSYALRGTTGGDTTPPATITVCLILKRVCDIAERWARGRIFVSPISAALFDVDGWFVGSIGSSLSALAAGMLEPLAMLEATLVPMVTNHNSPAPFDLPVFLLDVAFSLICGNRRKRKAVSGT